MTALEALNILETATLDCKIEDVNDPKTNEALDLLELHVQPKSLIPQFRYCLRRYGSQGGAPAIPQRLLRAMFPGIRDSVRVLLGRQMERLGHQFHQANDSEVKDEIMLEITVLAAEYAKLEKPWDFLLPTLH